MSKVDELYSNGMAKITAVFIRGYISDPVKGLKFISGSGVGKVLLLDLYNRLIKENSLVPVENLDKENKKELYDQCGQFEDWMSMCKILHLIKVHLT